jgi:hypothetical protein
MLIAFILYTNLIFLAGRMEETSKIYDSEKVCKLDYDFSEVCKTLKSNPFLNTKE